MCADPTATTENNQTAMATAVNPVNHNRTKHINIKFSYTRRATQESIIRISLQCCSTSDIITVVLRKPAYSDTFKSLRNTLGLLSLVDREEALKIVIQHVMYVQLMTWTHALFDLWSWFNGFLLSLCHVIFPLSYLCSHGYCQHRFIAIVQVLVLLFTVNSSAIN